MTPPHNCEQQEKFIEQAGFMGNVTASLDSIRGDINILFDQNREIIKTLSTLKDEVITIKVKFGVLGLVIGVFGSGLLQAGLLIIKKVVDN